MNQKHFFIIGFILLLISSVIMIVVSEDKLNYKQQVAKQLASMPALPVEPVGKAKNTGWQNTTTPTVILFFNSECGHCQNEATAIQERLEDFSNANLLFVSDEEATQIEEFSKTYKLDNKLNIWWLKMRPADVYNTFGNIGVPHIWVYNKENKLVKEFKGETKVEVLLEWL